MKLSTTTFAAAATLFTLAQADSFSINPYKGQFLQDGLFPIVPTLNKCFDFDGTIWQDKIRSMEFFNKSNKYMYCFFWIDTKCRGNFEWFKVPPGNPGTFIVNQIRADYDGRYSALQCNYGTA